MDVFHQTPLVCLAPMDSYTDIAFRMIVRENAPDVVLFTEFVSVDGLFFNPEEVKKKLFVEKEEKPVVVQLFGNDPDRFENAIQILKDYDISGIDINMGCPAHNIVKCQFGAALLQDSELAWKIAERCVKVSPFPVSVKTRLGWTDNQQIMEFYKGFEDVGVSAISVHGRTYKQAFSGNANWDPIYSLKEKTSMKVIGNGDIDSSKRALEYIQNLDGVMVGRAAISNPWLLQDIYESLKIGEIISNEVSFQERIPVLIKHCEYAVKYKGEKKGILEMRKFLSAYCKGFDGAKEIRNKLVRVETMDDVKWVLG